MSSTVRTRIYLKKTCPYSLKLRIFLAEAGIADRHDLVVFAEGDEVHKSTRTRMEAAGVSPSFPAAEVATGHFVTGTDALIARFAAEAGVEPARLPLLAYYSDGVFPRHIAMHQELKQLKGG